MSLVEQAKYKEFRYYVATNKMGAYCVYVEKKYGVDYTEIICHGGITYIGYIPGAVVTPLLCVGWSYGHRGDYVPFSPCNEVGATHHTQESVQADVKKFIDDLIACKAIPKPEPKISITIKLSDIKLLKKWLEKNPIAALKFKKKRINNILIEIEKLTDISKKIKEVFQKRLEEELNV